ncbi:MAG TPA: recombinase family protein, partial [Vicinamibacteria bacterium]
SGSYLERPALDRLRDLAKARAIDSVYIHSPDRLARRYAHQFLLMEELERYGCEVVFLEQTPSKDPNSQLLTQIQGAIAEYERAQIVERARRGKLYHSRQGAIVSCRAPYGYSYVRYDGERGCWEVNEDEASVVRELFRWMSEEAISVRKLTKRLNASPYKPRGRGPWTPSTVQNILTNEAYYGISYYNRHRSIESVRTDRPFGKKHTRKKQWRPREEWIPIPVPAILDKETFDRVQEQLKKNKAFSRRNLHHDDRYLLRCLLRCGVCGLSVSAGSTSRYGYYRCSGKDALHVGRVEPCPSTPVHADDLDTAVWEAIESLLRSPELMTKAWQHQRENGGLLTPDIIEAELQQLHDQTVDAERQIRRLVDGYQKGALRPDELSERRAQLEEKIAHCTEHRRRLEAQRPKWKEWKTVSNNLSSFCERVVAGLPKLNFQEKQKLLRTIIDRVVVTAGQLTIKLAIPLSTNFDLTPSRPGEFSLPHDSRRIRLSLGLGVSEDLFEGVDPPESGKASEITIGRMELGLVRWEDHRFSRADVSSDSSSSTSWFTRSRSTPGSKPNAWERTSKRAGRAGFPFNPRPRRSASLTNTFIARPVRRIS